MEEELTVVLGKELNAWLLLEQDGAQNLSITSKRILPDQGQYFSTGS